MKVQAKFSMKILTKVFFKDFLDVTLFLNMILHLIKQNSLLKSFLGTLILMTQVSLYLFFLLELI